MTAIEKLKTNKVNYKKGELGVLISHLSILIDIQNNPEYSKEWRLNNPDKIKKYYN